MTIMRKSAAWTEFHPAVYTDGFDDYTAQRDQDIEDPRENWCLGPALVNLNDPDDCGRYDDCPAIRVLQRLASGVDGDSVTLAQWEEACSARDHLVPSVLEARACFPRPCVRATGVRHADWHGRPGVIR